MDPYREDAYVHVILC